MPLPSLWNSAEQSRPWSPAWAAGAGAVIGALAAVFKLHGPFHEVSAMTAATGPIANVPEIVGAALAFALLCAGAAALRNFIARRLINSEMR
jgi:hypothetical protein